MTASFDILHTAMIARVEKRELPGMVAVIARDGGLLWWLSDRRVLRRIDGPLDDTYPASRPITVEDLLTLRMGSGMIIEPTFDPPFPIVEEARKLRLLAGAPGRDVPYEPDEWMRRFGSLPLMCQPGERWQYNTGSLVLGVLVARAAAQPLEEFLRTRLLEPLDMRDTGFTLPAGGADRLPSQYTTDLQTGKVRPHADTGADVWTRPPIFPSGAGGLLFTADDFLSFAGLLLDGGVHRGRRLLSERSVEKMTTSHLTAEQIAGGGVLLSGSGWGFGMAVTVAPDGVSPAPGRYGWAGGYGTTWFNDPHRRLIAIGLTQTDGFLWNGLGEFQELVARAADDMG
ncbi:MAG: beta-lactamase family protein [Acidimicrobiales bacterium]|nr:beta-lactamase family protein [Acidimicrobiales bacterium]